LLLLNQVEQLAMVANSLGWAFAIWGLALYFYTGIDYLITGISRIKRGKA
jgi:cardiolipin synthase